MARIKIADISKEKVKNLSPEELEKIVGGSDVKAFQRLEKPEDPSVTTTAMPKAITIAGRHNIC